MLDMGVRQRLSITCMLLAWFVASGAQWDLLQTVGWGRMFVTYSKAMPLTEAFRKTFDGEMCSLCRAVSDARRTEDAPVLPGGKLVIKFVLLFQPVPEIVFTTPDADAWPAREYRALNSWRPAPPVPPPRGNVA